MLVERQLHGPEDAKVLIKQCNLTLDESVDYTMGLFDDETLIATGSIKKDILQMLAVSPDYQGQDITSIVILHLIKYASKQKISTLRLFTKPKNIQMFLQLGFKLVAMVRNKTALMEWGKPGINEFRRSLTEMAIPNSAALVMNCNPFTLGHRWIIEQAAAENPHIFVLIVEEDSSMFPYVDRIKLVKEGTADLPNVTVLPGGRYIVSSLTFPSYFTAQEEFAERHSEIDAEIFVTHIAPALNIKKRYVGSEPFCRVTNIYNNVLIKRLFSAGIKVIILERLEINGSAVSASRVRYLLSHGHLDEIKPLVPSTTWNYLRSVKDKTFNK